MLRDERESSEVTVKNKRTHDRIDFRLAGETSLYSIGDSSDHLMMKNMNISKRLGELKKQGLNLTMIARNAKIPKATLHSWAAGGRVTDIDAVKRLADVLNVSVHSLLWGEEDPKGHMTMDSAKLQELFSGKFIVEMNVKKVEKE